jgi:hypothetical protein
MTFLHISLPKKGQQYNRLDCKIFFINVMTFLHISLPNKGQQYNRLDCEIFFYKCDGIVTYKFTKKGTTIQQIGL